jgi:hypothetical protein
MMVSEEPVLSTLHLRLAVHGYRLRVNEIQRTTKGSWMLADTAVGQAVWQIKNAQSYRRYNGKAAEKAPKLSLLGPVCKSADGS